MKTTDIEHSIDVCNSLLRGEISAVETYTQAIGKFCDEPEVALLEDIRRQHIASANRLREIVRDIGGSPSHDSGAWGTWARLVEGAAKLLGDSAALKALREGEEHGVKEHQAALDDVDLTMECKEMIRTELLPRQLSHISILRELAKAK